MHALRPWQTAACIAFVAAAALVAALVAGLVAGLSQSAPRLADQLPAPVQRWLGGFAAEPDWSAQALGPVLEAAQRRGELIVGVRAYRRPSPPGSPSPPEPDEYDASLARYIARTLNVRVRLVGIGPDSKDTGLAGKLARPPGTDLIIAGTRHDARGSPGLAPGQAVDTPYIAGHAGLVALRGAADSPSLAGRSVCLQQGSPYAHDLAGRHRAELRSYPSSVHAVYAFMSGECEVLAEDEAVLQRLMTREEWRFYRQVPARVDADGAAPQIVLARGDAVSASYLDKVVRHWSASGAQRQAREQRIGEVNFEVSALQDGLVCHS